MLQQVTNKKMIFFFVNKGHGGKGYENVVVVHGSTITFRSFYNCKCVRNEIITQSFISS